MVEQGFCNAQVAGSNPVVGFVAIKDMPKKQFISEKGDTWEWEETPAVVKAVKKLHESRNTDKEKS